MSVELSTEVEIVFGNGVLYHLFTISTYPVYGAKLVQYPNTIKHFAISMYQNKKCWHQTRFNLI